MARGPACSYVQHTYYGLCYDEEHEQPRWTVYILRGEKLREGRIRRTQDFRPDPKIRTQSAQLSDYKKSGYDRGHLVPAGDFKWDSIGMSETFYLSNMSPQLHEFNAGIWEQVESTVRAWARQKKTLVVYTGPILNKVEKRIGTSKVSVPPAFYKVVYHLDEKNPAAVGFIVPHAPSQKSPLSFLVSVDSVERVTGIDFFYKLPDDVEERIERRFERAQWEVKGHR
ncbi:MAG: DNA/RNA non-specific endonuclease [Bacteroidia bacterium]